MDNKIGFWIWNYPYFGLHLHHKSINHTNIQKND